MMTAEAVPPELDDTVERLENWGRWAEERSKAGRACSAEGVYRPRWGNNMSAEEEYKGRVGSKGPPPRVNPADAVIVGLAVAPASGFPRRLSLLLTGRYVVRANRYVICRRLKIHPDDYLGVLIQALSAARARLTQYEEASYSLPVTDATSINER